MNTYRVWVARATVRGYATSFDQDSLYEVDATSRDEAGQQARSLWLAAHTVSVERYPANYSFAAVRSIDPTGKEG